MEIDENLKYTLCVRLLLSSSFFLRPPPRSSYLPPNTSSHLLTPDATYSLPTSPHLLRRCEHELTSPSARSLQFDPAPRAGEPLVSRRVPDVRPSPTSSLQSLNSLRSTSFERLAFDSPPASRLCSIPPLPHLPFLYSKFSTLYDFQFLDE